MSVTGNNAKRFLLVLLLALSCRAAEEPEVYFSPGGHAQEAIEKRIDEAAQSVDVAMYAFTSRELAWALVRARERGVAVRVLLDGDFSGNQYSKGGFLENRKIEVRVDMSHLTHSGDFEGLMHHKFAVLDGQVVITGSYNWTASAQERNDENLLIFPRSPGLAHLYSEKFGELWERAIPYGSKSSGKASAEHEVLTLQASNLSGLRENAGKSVRVRGVVHRVGHSRRSNTYFLNFGPGRSSFTGVIFNSAARKFSKCDIDPKGYEGKRVEIRGRLIDHPKYGLEIIIEDPGQIIFVEAPK